MEEPSEERVRSVFLRALDREEAERSAFLDRECGEGAIREEVEAKLERYNSEREGKPLRA